MSLGALVASLLMLMMIAAVVIVTVLVRYSKERQKCDTTPVFGVRPDIAKRSSKWATFRKHWLEDHPVCEVCGGTKNLEVHHITPFHIDRALELDPNNVITLCERSGHNCHFTFGHAWNWKTYRKDVRELVAMMKAAAKNVDSGGGE